MEFEKVIQGRYSCRKFTEEPVSEEDLKKIIEAAEMAPLASGDHQTSHLTIVRDKELMEEIRSACMLKRKDGSLLDPLHGATTIIFFSATDVSEDHIEYSNAGCVVENMCLAATNLGLGSCYIWGCLRKLRNRPEVVEKLHLPEDYSILSAFVCGHTDEDKAGSEFCGRVAYDII
jgi:nitroreductase